MATGSTPICIARKATPATPPIGTVAPVSRSAEPRSTRNGGRSPPRCSKAAAGRRPSGANPTARAPPVGRSDRRNRPLCFFASGGKSPSARTHVMIVLTRLYGGQQSPSGADAVKTATMSACHDLTSNRRCIGAWSARSIHFRFGPFHLLFDASARAPILVFPSQTQIFPNLAKSDQARPKKIKGINFVFLVRIEPFQWVAPTPEALFSFLAASGGIKVITAMYD